MVSGYRRSRGWAYDHTYFFVAEFSRPFDAWTIDVDGKPLAAGAREGKGVACRPRFDFNDAGKPVLVKIGLSAVSVEGARKNLAAEIPAWDFEGTVAAAAKSWSDVLGKIEIETSDPAMRETFYTALYHSCIAPTLFNDADGSYCGLDHKVHEPEGFQNYCTFSLWDTFRAEHPLLTIIQPQRIDDFVGTHAGPLSPVQPARPARLVAGGQRDLVHDRQPRHPGDCRGLCQGISPLRRRGRLPGDARHRHAGPQFPERVSRTRLHPHQHKTKASSRSRGRWNTPTTIGASARWPSNSARRTTPSCSPNGRRTIGTCSITAIGFMRGK